MYDSNEALEQTDDFTAAALQALEALESNGPRQIELALDFGKTIWAAKVGLKETNQHRRFSQWCRDTLKRQPSWVSAHRRLYEARADLEPARDWAAESGHPWAPCQSVERILKVIADWRRSRENPRAPPKKRKRVTVTELRELLAEADADFVKLRDPLPPETMAEVVNLITAKGAGEAATDGNIAEIAKRFHFRRSSDLIEFCGAPQDSVATEAITSPSTDVATPTPGTGTAPTVGTSNNVARQPVIGVTPRTAKASIPLRSIHKSAVSRL